MALRNRTELVDEIPAGQQKAGIHRGCGGRRICARSDVDGIPLNFKVYDVIDVNAFACPDGSVRVFSSLMDIMDDDELLGVIGHEIGHCRIMNRVPAAE